MVQRYQNPQKMSPVEEKLVRSDKFVCLIGSESMACSIYAWYGK